MATPDKQQRKEQSQSERDLEERRKALEEYIADLRAFLEKLRRNLN
jgi:hypothetical protein